VEEFLVRHGLVAVVIGATLEGDLTMITAGVVAHLGYLRLLPALQAACLGGFIGDLVWYGAGRWRAAHVRETRLFRRAVPLIDPLVRRLGAGEIVMSRFVWGTRIASMFYWGVHGLGLARFAAIDLFGCALSATVLGLLGYGLSESARTMFGRIRRAERWLVIVALLGVAIVLGLRAAGRRAARARSLADDGGLR
jgi:membrane protein DedA with SNARE-associated domain